jgi:hypothetical protein
MKGAINKNVELSEIYHFVNWSLNQFGLDLELQSPKVGYIETVSQCMT